MPDRADVAGPAGRPACRVGPGARRELALPRLGGGLRELLGSASDIVAHTGSSVVGAAVLSGAVLWFALLLPEVDSGIAAVPAVLPIAGALVVAVAAGVLLRRWSGAPGWTDRHRPAVVIGALTASMAAGFLANQFGAVDLTVKAGLDIATLAGLAVPYRFFTVAAKP